MKLIDLEQKLALHRPLTHQTNNIYLTTTEIFPREITKNSPSTIINLCQN